MGRGEHLLGGDVGQEGDALLADRGGALPDGPVGQTHRQVGAVGALETDRLQVQGVHLVLQGGQAVEVGLPLLHRVAAGDPAGVEDQLPQLFDGLVFGKVGEELFGPGRGGHGRNGPLHPVVHGVAAPGHQRLAAGGVHPADLAGVQAGKGLGVAGQQVQHADAALALGVVEVAAQEVGLDVAEGFLAAQFHPGAGDGVVRPVDPDVPRAGGKGAAHAQPGQGRGRDGRGEYEGLPGLDVGAHTDDEVGVFFQQAVKVFDHNAFAFLSGDTVFSIAQEGARRKVGRCKNGAL